MTPQEKIQNVAEGFGYLAPLFLAGAKFALENQWISVNDDLPCNHEELLNAKYETKKVLILKWAGFFDIDYMLKINGKWEWSTYKHPKFWMPIPELPKRIGDKIIEREIGEIFKYNDVKLQVFEHGDAFKCNECYFVHRGIECTKQLCLRNQRNDRQSVIFKLIH